MVKSCLLVFAIAATGCFGRIESTSSVLTLPFHEHQDTMADYPAASAQVPTALNVSTTVTFAPFIPYYPLPVGFAAADPAFNEAGKWAPITIEPTPEEALRKWFERTVHGGAGPHRVIRAVVTDFQWYMVGFKLNAGRIATQLVVTDDQGAVLYSGTQMTRARVAFVDGLFRAHLRTWLADPKLVAALQGGTP